MDGWMDGWMDRNQNQNTLAKRDQMIITITFQFLNVVTFTQYSLTAFFYGSNKICSADILVFI